MTIENKEPQQEQTTATTAPATRDDLIAAVIAAGGGEVAQDDAATATSAETASEPVVEDRLDIILKARQKAHAEREATRQSSERILRDAEEQRDRMIADARAEARRITEQEQEQRRARFRENPVEALRNDYGDPQRVVDEVLKHGTSEAKALARAEAAERAAKEAQEVGQSAKKDFEDFKASQLRERESAAADAYVQKFLSEHASAEKAPHLHARFEPQEIAQRAVQQAQTWVQDGLRYRVDFDDADVVAYLERESKDRIGKILPSTPAAQQVRAAAPATEPGNAPKVQATGPRTLSAAQGSERRTSPKPLYQLPPDQRRQALIDEVNAAMRANPKAEY